MQRPSTKDRTKNVVKTISLPFGGTFVFDPKYSTTNAYQQGEYVDMQNIHSIAFLSRDKAMTEKGDYTIKVYDNKGNNIKFSYTSTICKKGCQAAPKATPPKKLSFCERLFSCYGKKNKISPLTK